MAFREVATRTASENHRGLYREMDLLIRGHDIALQNSWNLTFFAWHDIDAVGRPIDTNRVFAGPALASLQADAIDFDWERNSPAEGVPDDYFAIVATTKFSLPKGTYAVQADFGGWLKVYLDGRMVLDNWKESNPVLEAPIECSGGMHSLRVEYFAAIAFSDLRLRIRPALPAPQDTIEPVRRQAMP
jgi:PA14 domain